MDTHALTTIDSAGIDAPAAARDDRLPWRALVAGAIGVVLQPAQLWPSWLIGFLFCTRPDARVPRAADAAAHVGRAVGPGHAAHLRGGQRGCCRICMLLFIPIAIFAPSCTPGRSRKSSPATRSSSSRRRYLNLPFFIARAVIYFAVWWFCAMLLNKWSAAQDRGELGGDRGRHAPLPRGQRARAAALHPAHEPGVGRLDDVARPALVLDDLSG